MGAEAKSCAPRACAWMRCALTAAQRMLPLASASAVATMRSLVLRGDRVRAPRPQRLNQGGQGGVWCMAVASLVRSSAHAQARKQESRGSPTSLCKLGSSVSLHSARASSRRERALYEAEGGAALQPQCGVCWVARAGAAGRDSFACLERVGGAMNARCGREFASLRTQLCRELESSRTLKLDPVRRSRCVHKTTREGQQRPKYI